MQTLELLAPAKNLDCGISAINHGADAVYIGASRFGARAAAGNSIEDIKALCDYAHIYGAKVYVTVNTVIYDEELSDTLELCNELRNIGVDALLLQDMGLFSLLGKKDISPMALHASTQTDNRTAEKVRWLASLGFKRVVLARELSMNEIAEIHHEVPEVELEVFVHGALCVSYSGQCYASHYCFSRSANRGECAQFCRMPFMLKDADGNVIEESAHLLSLKDVAQLDNMERLAEAGAVSFKIEGRLKDADYVKNVTAAYSERLNEICRRNPEKYRRASMGKCTYTFTPNIYKTFNRGYTTYFFNGRQNGMVSPNTPKSIGEYVGKVKEIKKYFFSVSSTESFNNGDGFCFFNSNRQLIGFRVNKVEGNKLFPQQMPRELRPGTILYRNHDQRFQSLLSKPSAERKIEIAMQLTIGSNALTLSATDEHGNVLTATEEYTYQMAQKPQERNIRLQLNKLGDTPYICKDIDIVCDGDVPFIQSSLLAKLRRKVLSSYIAPTASTDEATRESVGSAPCHKYDYSFLYNASNNPAKEFYTHHGIEASSFETDHPSDRLLMQCRYCIRYEAGYCSKKGRKLPWREPLTISLDDGKEFTVKFNCKKCQMEIWAK